MSFAKLEPVIAAAGEGELGSSMSITVENDAWVLIVDAVILSATLLGSIVTLASMFWLEWRGRPSTTRMRIVQSLILSDFMLGLVGIIGVGMALGPSGLQKGVSCDALGVLLLAVLYSEHLWTLSLAIATYLILIHPLNPTTIYLEKKWWHLWVLVWAISFGLAVAGYKVTGLVPAGGLCYYGTNKPLFGELMQFIPRGFVFLVITLLYARLFVFLRRPDKIRSPYSDHTSQRSTGGSFSGALRTATRQSTGMVSSWFRRSPPKNYNNEEVKAEGPLADLQEEPATTDPTSDPLASASSSRSPSSDPAVITTPQEIPPWERVELPAFQIDGQKFGGSSKIVPTSSPGLWGNWKGLGGSSRGESRKRPSTSGTTGSSPAPQSTRKFGSTSSWEAGGNASIRRPSILSPRLEPITSYFGEDKDNETPRGARGSGSTGQSDRVRQLSTISDAAPLPSRSNSLNVGRRRSSAWTEASDISFLRSPTFSPTPELTEPLSPGPDPTENEKSSVPVHRRDFVDVDPPSRRISLEGEAAAFKSTALAKGDVEKQAEGERIKTEEEEDAEWDLMRMLQQGGPPAKQDDRFAPREGETVELVEESMASYLNRKTALLMLWFPLGYILLFSISLVRLIYDFVGKPPIVLRAISRWFVFSQGILDALIYGLVEWHTKRVVRRRVRKGTFEPTHSHSAGSTSWPRFLSRKSQPTNPQGQGSRGSQPQDLRTSVVSRQGQTHSVTFSRLGEQSILRDLEPLDTPRKGSAVDSVDTKVTEASVGSSTSAATPTKVAGALA